MLTNKEVFTIIKLILDSCRVAKDIDLSRFDEEIQLIRNIIKGSNTAIRNTLIKMELEKKQKVPVEESIAELEVDYQKGT